MQFAYKVLYFRETNVIYLNIWLAISGKTPPPFPACDWRFNEFQNPVAHALHVTWVELMALPVTGQEAGDALFDVIFKGSYVTHNTNIRANIVEWINAVGLVLSSLPVNIDFPNTAVKLKGHFRFIAKNFCIILVPRGRAPFGQHQESRPLARPNAGSLQFTDFPSLCACSESSLTNLIGSGLKPFRTGMSLDQADQKERGLR